MQNLKQRTLIPDYRFQASLIDEVFEKLAESGRCVLAAGCGGGKTTMAAKIISRFLHLHPVSRILVLTHGQSNLRNQFYQDIVTMHKMGTLAHSFTFRAVQKSLKLFGNESVLISLPHALKSPFPVGKFDMVIVDEAHNFYHAPMVQSILSHYKPTFTLALTGTPSPFIKDGNWPIVAISSSELLAFNVLSDAVIELVQTRYPWNFNSYNDENELRSSVEINKKTTHQAMASVLEHITRKLIEKGRISNEARKNVSWGAITSELGKTFFACKSIKQAKYVHSYLNKQGIKAIFSTSGKGKTSANSIAAFTRFKSEQDSKVLVVVNQGILGFNFPELANVVDMSGSHNPDRLFQLLSRVVRVSPIEPKKLFFKIVPDSMTSYTYAVMCFVVSMSVREFFLSYRGDFKSKSFQIPKKVLDVIGRGNGSSGRSPQQSSLPKLPTFSEISNESHPDFSEFAWTTLSRVRDILTNAVWTDQDIRDDAKKYIKRADWWKNSGSAYNAARYHSSPTFFEECCAHMKESASAAWTDDELLTDAKPNKTRNEWQKKSRGAYKAACKRGKDFFEKCCAHMEESHNLKWGDQELLDNAKIYIRPIDWYKGSPTHYKAAHSRGKEFFKKCCSPMDAGNVRWTKENCINEAKKYSSRGEWQTNSRSAYMCARKFGKQFFERCCSHMVPSRTGKK